MKSMPGRIVGLTTVAGALALFTASAMAGGVTPERASQLSYLVRQDCGACHGMTLKGGLGKPLNPGDLVGVDAATIAEVILDGVPDTPMPPWRGLLSEDEAHWIANALKKGLIQ